MVAYLDSSVALRHILLGDSSIALALGCDYAVSSELLEIECRRVLHMYRLNGDLDDEGLVESTRRLDALLDGVSLIALSAGVKRRAMEAFPVVVGTLDALHLASAKAFGDGREGETLLVFSHDSAMNRCATALGFSTPLASA